MMENLTRFTIECLIHRKTLFLIFATAHALSLAHLFTFLKCLYTTAHFIRLFQAMIVFIAWVLIVATELQDNTIYRDCVDHGLNCKGFHRLKSWYPLTEAYYHAALSSLACIIIQNTLNSDSESNPLKGLKFLTARD